MRLDKSDAGGQLYANQSAIAKSYQDSGLDADLVSRLIVGGVPFWLWTSLDAQTQHILDIGSQENEGGHTSYPHIYQAGKMGTGNGMLDYLVQNNYLNAQSAGFLVNGSGKGGATTPSAASAQQAAIQKGAVAQANKNLVAQPHAPGSGGAGGVPGGAYSVPQMTGGQLAKELKGIGFSMPFDITPMVKQALKESNGDGGLAMNIFRSVLYKSPQFKHYYPNYFAPDGTQRFSDPGAYDQQYHQYATMAQRQGFTLTRQQFGNVANAGKSADEFQSDVQVAATIKNNGALLANFNQIAGASGVKGLHNAKDAFNFLTGRGDPKQYQVWNAAAAKTAASAAGVSVGTAEAKSATGSLTGAMSYSDIEKSYGDLAQKVKDSGAELGSFGVTQRDLETLEFGGQNRSLIAARVSQAMAQTQAQGQTITGTSAATLGATGLPVAAQQQQQVGA